METTIFFEGEVWHWRGAGNYGAVIQGDVVHHYVWTKYDNLGSPDYMPYEPGGQAYNQWHQQQAEDRARQMKAAEERREHGLTVQSLVQPLVDGQVTYDPAGYVRIWTKTEIDWKYIQSVIPEFARVGTRFRHGGEKVIHID